MLKEFASFGAAAVFASTACAGVSYSFTNITNNNAGDAAIGEAQFAVEVIEAGDQAEFRFTNAGPEASSLVQLYWDGPQLLDLLDWDTTTPSGVQYDLGPASPSNLPGGNTVGFNADFSIDPVNQGGKVNNGVGPGEDVSIFFSLENTFAELIEALDKGELVVGLHAQGFRTGGSEAFITTGTPPSSVPSPTAALAGVAVMGLLANRRRRRK